MDFKDHTLAPYPEGDAHDGCVRYERRPALDAQGETIPGLYAAWIVLDNQTQLNSYTTAMVKQVILGFRRASNETSISSTESCGPRMASIAVTAFSDGALRPSNTSCEAPCSDRRPATSSPSAPRPPVTR